MSAISDIIKTSRPAGWIIVPFIFLLGFSPTGARLTFLPILQILMLSFPYSLFLYGTNDIYDYETDRLNPRKKLIEGVKLNPTHRPIIKRASMIVACLLIATSVLTLNTANIFGMLSLLFVSYYYSAPSIRLKERPPLDSLSNGAGFLSVFLIGYSFGGTILEIPLKAYLIAACVTGLHAFSTIMDYSTDKKVGQKTFSIAFGKRTAALFALATITLTLTVVKFETAALRYYLAFCSLLFLASSVNPSEKLASIFFKMIFIGFIVTAIVFLTIN